MHKNYHQCPRCKGWICDSYEWLHNRRCKRETYVTAPVDSEKERKLRALRISELSVGSDMLAIDRGLTKRLVGLSYGLHNEEENDVLRAVELIRGKYGELS